ncbi:N-acetyltransferase family protein [Crenobacter sp. SG2305]|uniref:arsinothricin resistance N-acetyltransferase ArsN1 family B n=1 Tax=Crenobacter oryzisoli TaxID=3056844 RepID=UPI0025AA5502|nr:arsinothricin resistance N-acetyltransferase ArsN1 family B [Crenobacter sp. SG2305]MDN0085133.1 N-acetyltransferase family protein [Crenobacter sp. SG2305]
MTMSSVIRPATAADAAAIAAIYAHYVANTTISFEEQVPTEAEMAQRLAATTSQGLPWLALEEDGRLLGYAYGGVWKGRSAYRHTVEASVYLDPAAGGRGLGSRLYQALFDLLREQGMHTVIASIALPNPASVALHERFGFAPAGRFSEVGRKFGQWHDVGYWQLLLSPEAATGAQGETP